MTPSEGKLALVGDGTDAAGLEERTARAITRATQYLVAAQHPSGYWQAPLEANATMEAEYIFFNRLLGRDKADLDRRMTERLLTLQQADGSWPLVAPGPGDPSTTIEAYFALKLVGLAAAEPALARAREFILAAGGLARARVQARCWLAYFGQFPWAGVPTVPIELVLLPPWVPVGPYAMASWTRSTLVPLALLLTHPPAIRISEANAVPELWVRPPRRSDLALPRSRELVTVRNVSLVLDRGLRLVERSPWKPFRRRAVARAIEWILLHQDKNGQWCGIQPATLHAILALHAVGFAPDHPAMVSGMQAVDDLLVECEGTLAYQPCVVPALDTALAAKALLDAGMDPNHSTLTRAGDWLIGRQSFRPGDWSVRNPRLEPGGWAPGSSDAYPSIDTSAAILSVLQDLPIAATAAGRRALAYGSSWTLAMQSFGGGYAAFDTDNTAAFLDHLPVAGMMGMTDPPTPDVTGRLLELMATLGYRTDFGRARNAVAFLAKAQRADGSWSGRWGVNCIAGTAAALGGLAAIGEDLRAPFVRRAVEWLGARQNPDGGFGETVASYDDESLAGTGESTASQTAWAVLGLLAAAGPEARAIERGIDYLVRTQGADGTWPEHRFTGTLLPGRLYVRHHLARQVFPLMALGRYRRRRTAASAA